MKKEILRTGKFTDSIGQAVNFSKKKLAEIASNFNKKTGRNASGRLVPLTVGHPWSGAAPAVGWIGSLMVEGGKLIAEFVNMTEEGQKLIENFTFRDVSSGLEGESINILNHVALTNFPAVNRLGEFQLSTFQNTAMFEGLEDKIRCFTASEEDAVSSDTIIDTIKNAIITQFQHLKQPETKGDTMAENNTELEGLKGKITAFESQVANLTEERDSLKTQFETVTAEFEAFKKDVNEKEAAAAELSESTFCDKLIANGQMLPAKKEATQGILKGLRGTAAFDSYKEQLEGAPKLSEFTNLNTDGLPKDTSENAVEKRAEQISVEKGVNMSQALELAQQEVN